MSQHASSKSQVTALELAWQRYAEFDANAMRAQKLHLRFRDWVIYLTVTATLLAVLSGAIKNTLAVETIIPQVLTIVLIAVPIASSVLLAYANKFQQGEHWLTLRAGAEEIKKEILLYRTLLQKLEDRDQWLNDRVVTIQRQVFESFDNDLILKPYTGNIPPYHDPNDKNSDPGFGDLRPDQYFQVRLEDQFNWHANKVRKLGQQRTWLQALIFIFGGLGTLLAAFGFNVWIALTAGLAAALTAWLELRQQGRVIKNYNRVLLELKIIRDHWLTLEPADRNNDEFFRLVINTEKVLWSEHSKFISDMRQAVAQMRGETGETLAQVAQMPTPTVIDDAVLQPARTALKAATAQTVAAKAEAVSEKARAEPQPESQQGLPHAFVVMPFGRKPGPDGRLIDFNSIYQQLIKPALEKAGFEPFRADEETISGDILTDMFQELLLADLVIADLSIDNANAFYELGVRHALRKRGVVHIQSGRAYLPFDIFNVRTIPYHTGEDGKPDLDQVKKDIDTIAKVAQATYASDIDRVHSPIFNLLDGLSEPDRKELRTPLATGYWREYREWQQRVDIARRQGQIGDVLLLTEEVRNPLIREQVITEAAKALSGLGHHEMALQQYRRGLEINPRNPEFRQQEAFELGRIKRRDEALVKLERLLQDNPGDCEAIALMGRLYKDMWVDGWQNIEDDQARLKAAYDTAFLLKKSIATYLAAYSIDQNHFYSGINALTLSMLLDDLTEKMGDGDDIDPEVEAVRQQLAALTGAVHFSASQAAARSPNDFWAFASLGDVAVNTADNPRSVVRAYQKALAVSGRSAYAVKSTLGQLKLLDSLGFRPEFVKAGIDVLQSALAEMVQAEQKEDTMQPVDDPVKIFLGAGHMIDHPQRKDPRFPAGMEAEAHQRIEKALDKLEATSNDMIITPGIACGGDILFIESCLKRQMQVEVYLPFAEARFIEESVSFAGDSWVERFYQIRQHPNVTIHLQPDRLGPVPEGDNPYSRNVRWTLYSTLCYGIGRVRLIVLWDGKGGDGPGGTGHLVKEVRQLGGIVEHIDTSKFEYWQKQNKMEVTPA
jgi:tetratricopeptide (TPR) repeat protein